MGTAFAGGANGLYPYLKSFFPNGVQAVSGFAYQGAGTASPLASTAAGANTVTVASGGAIVGAATTGANGYYYVLTQTGTFRAGTGLVAFTQANRGPGASDAAAYAVSAGASNTGNVNVFGGWRLDLPSVTATTLSAVNTADAAAAGATAAAGLALANREIDFAGASFAIDAGVGLTGTLALNGAGSVTQTAAITAGTLALKGGAYTLANAGNAFATLQANASTVDAFTTDALTIGAATTTAGASVTSGGAILLASGSTFANDAGAHAVQPGGGGRFLIYSQDAGNPTGALPNDSLGGLAGTAWYNDAFDFARQTLASAPPAGANSFVYGFAATATPTLKGAAVKTYDGSTTAPANALSVSATLQFSSAAFADANAGTNKSVTVSGVAFASNPDNFTLASTSASANVGTVNPLAVILSGTKTYDGTTAAPASALSLANGVNGEFRRVRSRPRRCSGDRRQFQRQS